jgi:hypothetical protein
MPIGAIRTETLSASEGAHHVCAAIAQAVRPALETAFNPGPLTAAALRAIVCAITSFWKPRHAGTRVPNECGSSLSD